jgi:hypothetical protein
MVHRVGMCEKVLHHRKLAESLVPTAHYLKVLPGIDALSDALLVLESPRCTG